MPDMSLSSHRFAFIVIEGIDGAGKTTVSQQLAKRLGGKYIRTPPPGFATARKRIDAGASARTRFLFYLSSVAYASELIRKELRAGPVVCDRYVMSTIACHRALGVESTWNLGELNLLDPDYTFFLDVSDEAVRQGRLVNRHKITASDRLVEDPDLRARMIAEYGRFPCVKIDTTGLTVQGVVEAICQHINHGMHPSR